MGRCTTSDRNASPTWAIEEESPQPLTLLSAAERIISSIIGQTRSDTAELDDTEATSGEPCADSDETRSDVAKLQSSQTSNEGVSPDPPPRAMPLSPTGTRPNKRARDGDETETEEQPASKRRRATSTDQGPLARNPALPAHRRSCASRTTPPPPPSPARRRPPTPRRADGGIGPPSRNPNPQTAANPAAVPGLPRARRREAGGSLG
ncbi:uncharacterized protein B0T15DRAFT_554073 [Chaetomium strumarium]|uniref:Uncharacterized protein n=1 Tax=Chaetomium strumarium TaxID=1170767 RepID=A0AAJ0M392_9PEZI|nr:hypothetical protein B0T15DRAFT_554073 [Chaetomium strumarium]